MEDKTSLWKSLAAIALIQHSLITCCSFASQNGDSATEPLGNLRAATSSYDSWSMRFQSVVEYNEEVALSPINRERNTVELQRSGAKELVSITSSRHLLAGGELRLKNDYLIYENGEVLSLQAQLGEDLEQVLTDGNSLMLLLSSKSLVEAPVRSRQDVYGYLGESGAAIWILGSSPIKDYLEANGKLVTELTDGGVKVTSSGRLGSFAAELSKANGWLPHEFSIVKSARVKLFGRFVRDLLIPEEEDKPNPKHLLRSVEWNGRALEYKTTPEGAWYASKLSVVSKLIFEGGQVNTTRCTIDISDAGFSLDDADASCETSIEVPVGYQVSIEEAPHLPYRWNGEKAVPGIPDMPRREASVAMRGEGDNYKHYLVAANFVAILIIVALLLRKRLVN